MVEYVVSLDKLGVHDVEHVGGKNASLGEMISNLAGAGVSVPGGFATTAQAYRDFLEQSGLNDRIHAALDALDVDDVNALAKTGAQIRQWVMEAEFPARLDSEIRQAFAALANGNDNLAVAVRSSATAEDLPDASFAGQQETFLNIRGVDNVIRAAKEVFASLFNDRAIAYRVHQGFDHKLVALSAGVQRMVRSETGTAGVMFTLDTESGFRDVVFITGAYGLGETVVQGAVNPDEFYVHKPTLEAGRPAILRRNLGSKAIKMIYGDEAKAGRSVKVVDVDRADRARFALSDAEVTELAKQAMIIEKHYGRPMDIEWAKDGDDGKLYIVQARPETVKSRASATVMERYLLKEKGTVLVEGRAIGQRIGAGPVKVINDVSEMDKVQPGDVLVSDMTDPDWEPVMKRASAIVTNRGGRTCHAAIIARELGIPAVVGCGNATQILQDGQGVTVSCAEGDTGFIFEGELGFDVRKNSVDAMPDLPFKIMMNVGNPDRAFDFAQLPNEGVGLARLEFIINRMIGVHPKALLNFAGLPADIKESVEKRIAGDQRRDHGALRAHPGRGEPGGRAAGRERPEARRERTEGHHDVRTAVERPAGRRVPRVLRWLLHRFQRPDPADPGPGSRFRHRCPPVRRAQSGGEEAAGQRHRCLQQGRQVHRHLRPGSVGPPGPGPLADGAGHRERLVEPRLGAGYLVLPRRGARPGLIGPRCIRKGRVTPPFFVPPVQDKHAKQ